MQMSNAAGTRARGASTQRTQGRRPTSPRVAARSSQRRFAVSAPASSPRSTHSSVWQSLDALDVSSSWIAATGGTSKYQQRPVRGGRPSSARDGSRAADGRRAAGERGGRAFAGLVDLDDLDLPFALNDPLDDQPRGYGRVSDGAFAAERPRGEGSTAETASRLSSGRPQRYRRPVRSRVADKDSNPEELYEEELRAEERGAGMAQSQAVAEGSVERASGVRSYGRGHTGYSTTLRLASFDDCAREPERSPDSLMNVYNRRPVHDAYNPSDDDDEQDAPVPTWLGHADGRDSSPSGRARPLERVQQGVRAASASWHRTLPRIVDGRTEDSETRETGRPPLRVIAGGRQRDDIAGDQGLPLEGGINTWAKAVERGAHPRAARMLSLSVVVAVLLLVAFITLLPVGRTYYQNYRHEQNMQAEAAALEERNATIQEQVDYLNTAQGVEDSARAQFGYVLPGEDSAIVTDAGDVSTTSKLPASIKPGSVQAQKTWYTDILDALFQVE